MPRILRNGMLHPSENWSPLQAEDTPSDAHMVRCSLDSAAWAAHAAALHAHGTALVLLLRPGETPPALTPTPALVVLEFSAFTDGRPFSLARRLREQYGYQGELRASGSLLPDQLDFLLRCGFDSIECPEDWAESTIERALASFSVRYQFAADDHLPAWRQRSA